jgi:hypothetical protein
MRATSQEMRVIVMTHIGSPSSTRFDELIAPPPGFLWRYLPESPLATHVRSILRIDARGVVICVGPGDAVEHAATLTARLLETGPPVVIAIADAHGPATESVLRQAGATYICAREAEQRLGRILESILDPPCRPDEFSAIRPTRELRMDAG